MQAKLVAMVECPQVLDAELVVAANRIYASIEFELSGANDTTFGVFECDDIVALGRFCRYDDGAIEIGGFWTREDRRGRGLARSLVEHVMAVLPPDGDCFCVPFVHLVEFYCSFGMEHVGADETVPASIVAKQRACQRHTACGDYDATVLLRVVR